MKKTEYVTPQMEVVEIKVQSILASSPYPSEVDPNNVDETGIYGD